MRETRLRRATAGMAVGTLLSRATGALRVVALAYAFGGTRLADVYNVANTTPNIVYDLVLGGILSSFIVPVFVEQVARGDEDTAWDAISAVMTAAIALLVLATALFVAVAPWVMRLYSHGSSAGQQQAVGTAFLRMFAPQVFFYGAAALIAAALNTRRSFFAPMATPVLNNLVVIGLLLALPHVSTHLSLQYVAHHTWLQLLIGLGTTAGVALQAIALLPSLRRAGTRLRPVWNPRHPAVSKIIRLSGWTIGYVVSNQLSFAFALWLAARHTAGVTAYSYAYIFFQVPYGILTVSILTALTPEMAEAWSERDLVSFRRHLATGLRFIALTMVPAAVGYVVLARPTMALVLEHGAFHRAPAHTTANALALFAVGLPAFSVYLLFVRAYTSMQDTRTPFAVNVVENVLTVVFDVVLYPAMGVAGLALGFSLAYVVGALLAARGVSLRVRGLRATSLAGTSGRALAASAVMAAAVGALSAILPGSHGVGLAVRVAVCVAAGVAIYGATLRAEGVDLPVRVSPSRSPRGRSAVDRRASDRGGNG